MARIRSVHPDICQSRTMAKLSAELERTFVRLWTHCDDEGRCEDRPRILKGTLYPEHDDITWQRVDDELEALQSFGLIVRYQVDGESYIAVRSWTEYQHPQKARDSQYPPPPDQDTSPTPPDEDETPPVAVRDAYANGKGLELGDGEGDGVGEGVVRESSSSPPPLALVADEVSPPATARSGPEAVFAAWQEATGHRRSKLDPKRRRAITAALKTYPLDDVIAAVRGWRNSPFHCGQNEHQRPYNDLSLLLRDAEHIERFRDLERDGPAAVAAREPKSFAALRRVVGELGEPS